MLRFFCICFFICVLSIFFEIFSIDLWAKIHKIRGLWEKN